jgi:hypothetical protein
MDHHFIFVLLLRPLRHELRLAVARISAFTCFGDHWSGAALLAWHCSPQFQGNATNTIPASGGPTSKNKPQNQERISLRIIAYVNFDLPTSDEHISSDPMTATILSCDQSRYHLVPTNV